MLLRSSQFIEKNSSGKLLIKRNPLNFFLKLIFLSYRFTLNFFSQICWCNLNSLCDFFFEIYKYMELVTQLTINYGNQVY